MRADLFDEICQELGYEPDRVLSVRVTSGKAVVVFTDASGDLRRATHRPVEIAPTPQESSHVRRPGLEGDCPDSG
jgi:hypothetical protein